MDGNSASTPVPAGDRPINRQPPVSFLKDFKGMVLSEARNRYGCEFLNQKLQERKPKDIQMIFSEVKDDVGMLVMDRFGCNVIQKLFPVCGHEQMDQLVFSITADVRLLMAICLDSRGSQSMQKLIDCLTTETQLVDLTSAFREIIIPLATHRLGSSVIRHYFHVFHGAEVEVFISELHPSFLNLPLGIQDVLVGMVGDLRGRFLNISKDKYASNVVKKLMKATKETYAPEIINEIISSPNFLSVLQNPYGYDVIRSAKEYSTGTVRETLNHVILQCSDRLHDQHPGMNALPNKKNHVLLNKKRKRNHVLLI